MGVSYKHDMFQTPKDQFESLKEIEPLAMEYVYIEFMSYVEVDLLGMLSHY